MLSGQVQNSQSKESMLLNTYNRMPVEFVHGDGQFLYDAEGKKYLDFLSGIAVTGFGHNHPAISEAVNIQFQKLWHVSNLFHSVGQTMLADKLCAASGGSSVFFCNSGTEANEAAIKFARLWGKERFEIITAIDSFHGRTLGSLSATGQYKLWKDFRPLTPGFKYVPFGEIEVLEFSINEKTVAIMLEPIQGEGGINVPGEDYLTKVKEICDKHNLLLIVDEIQTGIGRTGKMFAYQWENIQPDIITTAKGIANGLPLGAVICNDKVSEVVKPGSHGSTFGGNPVAVAAANAVLDLLTPDKLKYIEETGEFLKQSIKDLNSENIEDVRGKGLIIGIQLAPEIEVKDIVAELLKNGIVTCSAGNNTLRILPPFIIDKEDINLFIYTLKSVFYTNHIHKND